MNPGIDYDSILNGSDFLLSGIDPIKPPKGAWNSLGDYFIRPGEATAVGIGADFVIGRKGFSIGAGYVKMDMDGNPLSVDKRGFYYYFSNKVYGLDVGIQIEALFSPNPGLFFGESSEIGGSIYGYDGSIASGNPGEFLTSPADHIYGIGVGPGIGAHWSELNTKPLLEW